MYIEMHFLFSIHLLLVEVFIYCKILHECILFFLFYKDTKQLDTDLMLKWTNDQYIWVVFYDYKRCLDIEKYVEVCENVFEHRARRKNCKIATYGKLLYISI